jgi:LuxR family maltose regulon positive regulatory protein
VDAADSLAVIDAVASHLPASSTFVLCGRSHADHAALARRRLRPGVVDVTSMHLALDATETDELLRSMGAVLELEALSQLCDRFEGWAAGLRLAGLALRGEGERSWMSPDHVGDATYIVDYLRSEWTGQLSAEDRQFLGEVACLQRFTGDMCDEVLGRTQSVADLRRMHRDELLVLPLDQRDEWFRMHPILTRWLSADLQETDPDRWRSIHAAAADWWGQHGDIDLAFEHALATPDLARAEALVVDHAFSYMTGGHNATVRRWLAAFPPDHLLTSGGLCAIISLDAVQHGDGVRAIHWYEQLERVLARVGAADADDRLVPRSEVLRITVAREPTSVLLPIAEVVAKEMADDLWTALALYALGGLRFLDGDDRAADSLASAAFVAELNGLWLHQANCTSARGIVADLADDRDTAVRDGEVAVELLARLAGELPPTTAMSDSLRALNAARAGQRDLAADLLEAGKRKLVSFQGVAPWFNVLCRVALIRAAVLIDDRPTSRTLLRELEHVLRLEPAGHGAEAYVQALRKSIDAARQLPSGPAWALTEAELKVLQHLPTNLTLADIATRLFVSRNTVKSHVAAIYRKLNATSRSDAVELARATGLLDDMAAEARD